MANEEHLQILRQGSDIWNRWRRNNPEVTPDFYKANLRGANLRGANLCEADLRRANLCGADLRKADLRGANLCEADLRRANFYEANLRGTNLRGANLCGDDLRRANLCGADLRKADLDFSCLPLWCGGQSATIDERLARQLLAHALAFKCDAQWYQDAQEYLRGQCNQSHIAGYMNWLKEKSDVRRRLCELEKLLKKKE